MGIKSCAANEQNASFSLQSDTNIIVNVTKYTQVVQREFTILVCPTFHLSVHGMASPDWWKMGQVPGLLFIISLNLFTSGVSGDFTLRGPFRMIFSDSMS